MVKNKAPINDDSDTLSSNEDLPLGPADELVQVNAALTEDLQKVQAEFLNYKRRAEEERPQQVAAGKTATVIKLIPVIDNIERALTHAPDDIAGHDYFKGLAGVHKQLLDAMQEIGIEKVKALEKQFDPEYMNAVMSVDVEGVESQVVVEVMQDGYLLNGAVVREALVKVST